MGFVGKRHARLIERRGDARLAALCDLRSPEECQAQDLAAQAPFFYSMEQMLQAVPDLDVVCICTPNALHAPQSIAALRAGLHVVCEKPMALRKSDAEAMIHASLQANRRLFCVMQNRYSPPSAWLKNALEQGILGDIYLVQANCYWNRDRRYYSPNGQPHPWKGRRDLDGGTLFTQFSHFVDMLYWMFGDIKNIQARFANFNHGDSIEFEDSGLVQFDWERGGMGCLHYSTSVYEANLESSLTVIGSRGSVKIGGQYMNQIEHCRIQDYTLPTLPPTNPANDYGAYQGSAANHAYVFDNVLRVLQGLEDISTNALEGLKVVEIIERIYGRR